MEHPRPEKYDENEKSNPNKCLKDMFHGKYNLLLSVGEAAQLLFIWFPDNIAV